MAVLGGVDDIEPVDVVDNVVEEPLDLPEIATAAKV